MGETDRLTVGSGQTPRIQTTVVKMPGLESGRTMSQMGLAHPGKCPSHWRCEGWASSSLLVKKHQIIRFFPVWYMNIFEHTKYVMEMRKLLPAQA